MDFGGGGFTGPIIPVSTSDMIEMLISGTGEQSQLKPNKTFKHSKPRVKCDYLCHFPWFGLTSIQKVKI